MSFVFRPILEEEKLPLTPVSQVDLDRYLGRWYQIAFIPTWFQSGDSTDATAEYSLIEGGIRVRNTSLENGKWKEDIGIALSVDSSNSRLKVSFGYGESSPEGNYWVLYLDPDYNFVMVGSPTNMLWILSREPGLDSEIVSRLFSIAVRMGYKIDDVIIDSHRGHPATK